MEKNFNKKHEYLAPSLDVYELLGEDIVCLSQEEDYDNEFDADGIH